MYRGQTPAVGSSIDFGKTVGPIFKIWPVDKVIQKIKFGQKLRVPVYCSHIGFTLLLLVFFIKSLIFLFKNWKIFFNYLFNNFLNVDFF